MTYTHHMTTKTDPEPQQPPEPAPRPTSVSPFVAACKKLNQARDILHAAPIAKSGHNTFSNYYYFELGDFLPTTLKAFSEVGLCGLVSFSPETATLTVVDLETGGVIHFNSPMSEANLKGCHPVQNLGAVETYQRRYLWSTAMEVLESDLVNQGQSPPAPAAPAQARPAQTRPAQATPRQQAAPRKTAAPAAPTSKPTSWTGEILEVKEVSGIGVNKKQYTFWAIKFTDGREANTFSETLCAEARNLIYDESVGGPTVWAEVTKRPDKDAFKLEKIEAAQEGDQGEFVGDDN